MSWLVLTILAIVARAAYSVATILLSQEVKVSPITHSLLLTFSAGILSLLLSPFVGGISLVGIQEYGFVVILMIFSQAFGNILFFKGIQTLDSGTSQIAFSSILIWGTILSVMFLDSVFSLQQLIGIMLMLIAIVVLQYKKQKLNLNLGFLYIIISAILFAVFQISSADLSKGMGTGSYLILAYLGPSLVVGIIYFSVIRRDYLLLKSQVKNTLMKTLFTSGTSLLYFVLSYLAYRYAPDRGVVVVLLTAQAILSVLFGVIFLKERENLTKKSIAGILAFISGILIKS